MKESFDHEHVRSRLSDYLENDLPVEQAEALSRHLETCLDCRTELELLKKTVRLVQALPPIEAPAEFSKRLRGRLRQIGQLSTVGKRRRSAWRQRVPFEGTLAVVMATIGALVISLLLFQADLNLIVEPDSPLVLSAKTPESINQAAQMAWKASGSVFVMSHLVPPYTPLGGYVELEISIPGKYWSLFVAGLAGTEFAAILPQEPPGSERLQNIRILVQLLPTSAPSIP